MCTTDCGSQPLQVKDPFKNLLKAADSTLPQEHAHHTEPCHQGPSVDPESVSPDATKRSWRARGEMRPPPCVLAGDGAHLHFPLSLLLTGCGISSLLAHFSASFYQIKYLDSRCKVFPKPEDLFSGVQGPCEALGTPSWTQAHPGLGTPSAPLEVSVSPPEEDREWGGHRGKKGQVHMPCPTASPSEQRGPSSLRRPQRPSHLAASEARLRPSSQHVPARGHTSHAGRCWPARSYRDQGNPSGKSRWSFARGQGPTTHQVCETPSPDHRPSHEP